MSSQEPDQVVNNNSFVPVDLHNKAISDEGVPAYRLGALAEAKV